jgi:branched-chain amino acid transport system permease protein
MSLDRWPVEYYYLLILVLLVVIASSRLHLRRGFAHRPRVGGDPRTRSPRARWASTAQHGSCSRSRWARHFSGVRRHLLGDHAQFISPSFVLIESMMVLSMVVLAAWALSGADLGAVLLSFMPEVLRYTVRPAQERLFDRMLIRPKSSTCCCSVSRWC